MSHKAKAEGKLTRRQNSDLDIEIGFLEALVRRDPGFVEALELLGDDHIRRGNVAEGIRIDQRLARLRPHDPRVLYNLACGYSILHQRNQAVRALIRAIDAGYRDFQWLARDPDLENLRSHSLFAKVQAKIRSVQESLCHSDCR